MTKTQNVAVQELLFEGKFSLRCSTEEVAALSSALGVELPGTIGGMTRSGSRAALCLGPDEWMILCAGDDRAAVTAAGEAIYDATPHSLVDVSFREVGLSVIGVDALTLLCTSCARDLGAIEIGKGTRTIFDGAQVVIIRDGTDAFRMYVWRSFYPHTRGLLAAAERELAFGI